MLVRFFDSLCLRALGSAAVGRAVRAGIVLASRTNSPRGEAAAGETVAMVPAR